MENVNDEQMKAYTDKLLNKFKQDPQYELKQEFGKLLMIHVEDFTPEQLVRYNELKQSLKS